MTDMDGDWDPQDQAEVLDESNLTEAGTDFVTFEEIEDEHVQDLTQLIGDADDQAAEALDEADFDEDAIDDEDLEGDEDSPDELSDFVDEEVDIEQYADPDPDELDGVAALESDEVELEYAGDLTDLEHARSSAKPYESTRELSDEDLQELGYQDREGHPR
jgi:hypothetical protein